MGPNQFPGQTLQPLPASPSGFYVGDDEFSLLQKICQNLYSIVQSGGGGGGSGSPGLPVWTFAAADNSDPASGKFTTDSSSGSAFQALNLSINPKNGGILNAILPTIPIGANVLLVDSAGKCISAVVAAVSAQADFVAFNVSNQGVSGTFSGDYQVSFWPGPLPTTPTLAQILANAGITPAADATVTPVTSVTTQTGIATNIS